MLCSPCKHSHCGQDNKLHAFMIQGTSGLWRRLLSEGSRTISLEKRLACPLACRPGHLLRAFFSIVRVFYISTISLLTVSFTCNNDSDRTMFYFPDLGGTPSVALCCDIPWLP